MDDDLQLSERDYDDLPDDPEQRFVLLEGRCRQQLNALIGSQSSSKSDLYLRRQYASLVSGYAEGLGIEDVAWQSMPDTDDEAQSFLFNATRVTARIKARTINSTHTVRLAQRTRGKIEQQIEVLKRIIQNEVQDASRRQDLLTHLENLRKELGASRVSLAKVMLVLAKVALGAATGTTFLAEAPHAIATISSLLGRDKAAEDAEAKRLGAPPQQKALPVPQAFGRTTGPKPTQQAHTLPDDDELPF